MVVKTPSALPEDESLSLYDALCKVTTARTARALHETLGRSGLETTVDVLRLTEDEFTRLSLSPHLRQVLGKLRGGGRYAGSVFEASPLEGYVNEEWVLSPVNLAFIIPLMLFSSYILGTSSFYNLVERVTVLVAIICVLFLLLLRSFYVLFSEEEIGELHITVPQEGYFDVKTTLIKDGARMEPVMATASGDDVGVVVHEILLSPALNFLGFPSRLSWSSVVSSSIDGETKTTTQHLVTELHHIPAVSWRHLETLPALPGIRAIQRKVVLKAAIHNSTYSVKKNISGLVWLEQK